MKKKTTMYIEEYTWTEIYFVLVFHAVSLWTTDELISKNVCTLCFSTTDNKWLHCVHDLHKTAITRIACFKKRLFISSFSFVHIFVQKSTHAGSTRAHTYAQAQIDTHWRARTHAQTHTHTHTYTHTRTRARTHTHTHSLSPSLSHWSTYTHMHAHTRTYTHIPTHTHVKHTHTYTTHTYTHTHAHTHAHTRTHARTHTCTRALACISQTHTRRHTHAHPYAWTLAGNYIETQTDVYLNFT